MAMLVSGSVDVMCLCSYIFDGDLLDYRWLQEADMGFVGVTVWFLRFWVSRGLHQEWIYMTWTYRDILTHFRLENKMIWAPWATYDLCMTSCWACRKYRCCVKSSPPETYSSQPEIGLLGPKRKCIWTNHGFSGAMLVSGRVLHVLPDFDRCPSQRLVKYPEIIEFHTFNLLWHIGIIHRYGIYMHAAYTFVVRV